MIVGAGNIGSKIALRLLESGSSVYLTRRNKKKLKMINEALNVIKPIQTKAKSNIIHKDRLRFEDYDVIIGCADKSVKFKKIKNFSNLPIIVDVGKGTFTKSSIKQLSIKKIPIFRPKGGDEINLINLDKDYIDNFGWPISSYGNHYDVVPINSYTKKYAPLNKSHKEFGFVEPLKFFENSIGISEIIQNYFDENNSIFVSSLKARTIYEIELDKYLNFIQIKDKINVGERIRDIIFDKEYNCYLIYAESTPKLISMCLN